MSENIENLSPSPIWKNFSAISQIPRASKKEEKIIAFMKDFGHSLGLETIVDETGNVIIKKPATPGNENKKTITLQSHLDMVHQKNSETTFNFDTDPIQTFIDGDWVKARGTTLGADNGIGVASIMAVLQSKEISHGPIEALFTIDEESGMTGAFGLKGGILKGDILLNLDSEDEGELYIGCAGGVDTSIEVPLTRTQVPAGSKALILMVKGLKGGHSGMDIPLGRGNANILLARLLISVMEEINTGISEIDGGGLRNAIPREARAVVTINKGDLEKFNNLIERISGDIKKEYGEREPGLDIVMNETELPSGIIEPQKANRLLAAIHTCPNGVDEMSQEIENLVETSSNLARVKTDSDKAIIQTLQRSSVDTAKMDLARRIRNIFELIGGSATHNNNYPGWKPDPNSHILKTMKNSYKELYGKVPDVKAVHAGLECGIIGEKYPDMEMISFGPTIRNPHSPDEKVHIPSVGLFWDYLVDTLERI